MKQAKSPEAGNEEKATKSIEGIEHGLLNAETSKLLSGSEIYRIWVMKCTKQVKDFFSATYFCHSIISIV